MSQSRDVGIGKDRYSARTRSCLNQDILPFSIEFGRHQADPGNVGTRTSEGRRKSSGYHILCNYHDGNCSGRLLEGSRRGIASAHDRVGCGLDQPRHQFFYLIAAEFKPSWNNCKVLTFGEALDAQLVLKSDHSRRSSWEREQTAKTISPARLLRSQCKGR